MGKETLKEFAEKYSVDKRHKKKLSNREFDFAKNDFINGAKWQQEQIKQGYSEEEVINILVEFSVEIKSISNITEWFEQFKKK